jgi:hypothetical protein
MWGSIMTVKRRGAHLFEQIGGGPEKEVFAKSETEFFVKGVDVQITFIKGSSGKADKLIFHNYGIDVNAMRVKEPKIQ